MALKSVESRNVEFKFNLLCRNKGVKDAVGTLWGQTPKLTFKKRAAFTAGSGKPH